MTHNFTFNSIATTVDITNNGCIVSFTDTVLTSLTREVTLNDIDINPIAKSISIKYLSIYKDGANQAKSEAEGILVIDNTIGEFDLLWSLTSGLELGDKIYRLAVNELLQSTLDSIYGKKIRCFKQTDLSEVTPIEYSVAHTDETATDADNGSITVTVIQGGGNYEYSIDNGSTWQSGNIFSSLVPSTYTVKVKSLTESVESDYTEEITINEA